MSDVPIWIALLILAVVLGMLIGGSRQPEHVTPCPQQAGYKQDYSYWTKDKGLSCYYTPIIERKKK